MTAPEAAAAGDADLATGVSDATDATGAIGTTGDAGATAATGATGRTRLWAQARFWLAVGLVLAGLVFWTRAGFAIPPKTIAAGPLPLMLAMVGALAYAGVGLLLAIRRPEVRIGAIEAWLGVLIGGLAMAWAYLALVSRESGDAASLAPYVALAAAILVTPTVAALAIGLVLLFPTDRLLSPSWRHVPWVAVAGVILAGLGRFLRRGQLTFVGDYDNPVGTDGLGSLPALLQLSGYVALGVAAVLAGVSVVQRYVRGNPVERAQLRVFAGLTAAGTLAFVLFVGTFLVPDVDPRIRDAIVVFNLVIATFGPLALALAIARYRLWEIDQLVGKTFVYGALTAILAGVYAASLRLFQTVFVTVTGQDSDAALVITTLILATTFTPIKDRLEKLVKTWSRDPARGAKPTGTAAEGTAGGGTATGSTATPGDTRAPAPAPAERLPRVSELFSDPAFVAALDERIGSALRAHSAGVRDSGENSPSGKSGESGGSGRPSETLPG
ncbi:MAG: hypothetical protein QOH61_43 [Chloroflexota bacterium]|nr:hypothetical protein [Chloroflexota bacterium]